MLNNVILKQHHSYPAKLISVLKAVLRRYFNVTKVLRTTKVSMTVAECNFQVNTSNAAAHEYTTPNSPFNHSNVSCTCWERSFTRTSSLWLSLSKKEACLLAWSALSCRRWISCKHTNRSKHHTSTRHIPFQRDNSMCRHAWGTKLLPKVTRPRLNSRCSRIKSHILL